MSIIQQIGFQSICNDPKYWRIIEKAPEELHNTLLEHTLEYRSNIGNVELDRKSQYPGQCSKVLHFFLPDYFREFIVSILHKHDEEIKTSYWRSLNHVDFSKDIHFGIPNKFGYGEDGKHGRIIYRHRFEYTPLHINYGTLHFTYFVKVPYSFKSEREASPNPAPDYRISDKAKTVNGSMYCAFPFEEKGMRNYETGQVDVDTHAFYTDIKSEGYLYVYPNYLMTGTFPFYSTKEQSIEITGPITFNNPITLI